MGKGREKRKRRENKQQRRQQRIEFAKSLPSNRPPVELELQEMMDELEQRDGQQDEEVVA